MTDPAAQHEIEAAWRLYCDDTAGDMHVHDFWEQLPERVQALYLAKARAIHMEDA